MLVQPAGESYRLHLSPLPTPTFKRPIWCSTQPLRTTMHSSCNFNAGCRAVCKHSSPTHGRTRLIPHRRVQHWVMRLMLLCRRRSPPLTEVHLTSIFETPFLRVSPTKHRLPKRMPPRMRFLLAGLSRVSFRPDRPLP